MTSSALRNLSKVDVYVSVVLASNLEQTWEQARDFGHSSFWNFAGDEGEFLVKRLKGKSSAEVGTARMFKVGEGRLFEKLTALDDLKHNMRWMVISHANTVSPFGQASFLNYSSRLRFKTVTNTNQTFGEWKGEFYTEPQYAEQMEVLLSTWYHAGFEGLQVSVNEGPVPQGHSSDNSIHPQSSGPINHVPELLKAPIMHEHGQYKNQQQKGAPPPFDMGLHMQNWASRRFTYNDREQPGHPIGLAKKQRAAASSHPMPATSSRLSRQGSEGRQLSDPRLAVSPPNSHPSFPMQGPPVHSNMPEPAPARFTQTSSRSSRSHRPSSTNLPLAPPTFPVTGSERSGPQSQVPAPDYMPYAPEEVMTGHPDAEVGSKRHGSNGNQDPYSPPTSHAQEREMEAGSFRKKSLTEQSAYDASHVAMLRPSSTSAQPGADQHQNFMYRSPLSAEQRVMHTKPSMESTMTSGSQRSGGTFPRMSTYASQQSLDPPGYQDELGQYDSQYSQGLPSGPFHSVSPSHLQDHAMQEAPGHHAHTSQGWNPSAGRERLNTELNSLPEEPARYSPGSQYSRADVNPYSPVSLKGSAPEHDRAHSEEAKGSGGSTSTARKAREGREAFGSEIPNSKVKPSPFAQPAVNSPKPS